MTTGFSKSGMKGASLAECVLALMVFVGLAVCVPMLEERGLVQTAPERIDAVPASVDEHESAPLHVAEGEVEHVTERESIEVAVASVPTRPYGLAMLD